MSDTIIIESADADVPLDPKLLREIRDLLRANDDLDLGLKLTNRPPAPGEQGGVPVALEVLAVTAAASRPFAKVLAAWLRSRHTSIKVRDRDHGRELELDTKTAKLGDVERLITKFLEEGRETK